RSSLLPDQRRLSFRQPCEVLQSTDVVTPSVAGKHLGNIRGCASARPRVSLSIAPNRQTAGVTIPRKPPSMKLILWDELHVSIYGPSDIRNNSVARECVENLRTGLAKSSENA